MSEKLTIGPLKIKHFPNGKYEAECHLCRWTYHDWHLDKAEELLLWHIDKHVNPPERYVVNVEDMPGR